MLIEKFVESTNYSHWDQEPLSGYIYTEVYNNHFLNLLKRNVYGILTSSSTKTFMTNNLVMNVDGKQTKLASSTVFGRNQNVIFDYTFDLNWYQQTTNTIKKFVDSKIASDISPLFQKVVHTIYNVEPFSNNPESWVIYRCHLNNLQQGELLGLHYDGNANIFNTTVSKNRMYSITTYLYDHVENKGGELWSVNGFVYKPKANSMLAIKGVNCLHGVTANMNESPRHAFTVRIAHKDDFYLPGKDNFIWKLNTLE